MSDIDNLSNRNDSPSPPLLSPNANGHDYGVFGATISEKRTSLLDVVREQNQQSASTVSPHFAHIFCDHLHRV